MMKKIVRVYKGRRDEDKKSSVDVEVGDHWHTAASLELRLRVW